MEDYRTRCLVEECERAASKRKFCDKHYQRWRKYGDPLFVKQSKEFHGGSGTLIYGVWVAMKERCNNPKDKSYKDYGGRGIKVCERWNSSFKNFSEDMGDRPRGLTLERVDNDGNYEPSNCKWVSRQIQSHNKRLQSTNKSGYKGVFFEKRRNLWQAYIGIDKKRTWLGYFTTKQEAVDQRLKAEAEYLLTLQ